MAEEKKVNVTVNANAALDAASVKKLMVEREAFTGKDGNEYWSYVVRGKIRGRDIKVDFVAKDQGGYEVLDIIFDVKETAELVMRDEVMTNDDGTQTAYTVYEVRNVDEDGIEYAYKVKPARESDKALLAMLLKQKEVSPRSK